MRDDASQRVQLMDTFRAAQHADNKGYKEFHKKMTEVGS